MKLTTYDITYIVRKFDLKTPEDFLEFGLKLIYIREGCSRAAYKIRGYNLVVKIPFGDKSAVRHSMNEWKAFNRIKKSKKYIKLKKYLPNMYCCTKSGVILMDKYKPCGYVKWRKQINVVRNLSGYLFPENEGTDMCDDNLGVDAKGNLVILDFGCYFKW